MYEITEPSLSPTILVIFGGTGDLASNKLLPALFDLYLHGRLPTHFRIVAMSRKPLTDSEYQTYAYERISQRQGTTAEELQRFCEHIRYVSGDFADVAAYAHIGATLRAFDTEVAVCSNKLFYLAVPPYLYANIFDKLNDSGLMTPCVGGWSRLLVEKPFGNDLTTAKTLEEQLCRLFAEEQIYRIDHCLAKEAIENIVSLRFANSIIADSWQGTRIESIDIRLYERADVVTRGAFYDGIGALRDVGQNHMLQIAALLTMPTVNIHDAASVRAGRTAALNALESAELLRLTRGQYEGYTNTPGVAQDSTTETYFKIEAKLTKLPWSGVRLTLESGKALSAAFSEAVITFAPTDLCQCGGVATPHHHRNVLRIRFSPEQSIHLTMWIKEPGFEFRLHERELVLAEQVGEKFRSPEAYERVLYDCIVGDQTRFVSGSEVQAEWSFITPILAQFATLPLTVYAAGSEPPFIKT